MPNPNTPQGAPTQPPVSPAFTTQSIASLGQYDAAYDAANNALANVQQNLAQAINDYNNAPTPSSTDAAMGVKDPRAIIEQRIQSLQTAYNSALADRQRAADARAKAYADLAAKADPQTQALLKAQTEKAQSDAQLAASQAQRYSQTADDQKALIGAQIGAENANAAKTNLENAFNQETDPQRKALLQQQLNDATSKAQQSAVDAQYAQQFAQQKLAQGNASVAETQANTAKTQADTGLIGAQTGLVGAQQANENATANRTNTLLPGEVQAQQTGIAKTQADIDRQNALLPGELAQQSAATGEAGARSNYYNAEAQRSQESINQARQGALYGLQDRIQQISDAYKNGQLSSLPNPQQFVNDYITAATSGTTPFDIFKAQQGEETNRLGQQVAQRDVAQRLQGMKASAFASLAGQGLQAMSQLNNTLPPGSNAAGKGFVALINYLSGLLGGPSDQGAFSLGPAVQIPNAPSYLDQYRGAPQQQQSPIPPPPPAPSMTDTNSNTNAALAQSQAKTTALMPNAAPAPPQPQPAASMATPQAPAYLNNQRPAGVQDVLNLFGAYGMGV